MAHHEGEKFGNNENDDPLDREMNEMLGKIEGKEEATFRKEQEAKDSQALADRADLKGEDLVLGSTIALARDILDNQKMPGSTPLRSIMDNVGGRNEDSAFRDNSKEAFAFFTQIQYCLDKGMLTPTMSLAEAVQALEDRRADNSETIAWGDLLMHKNSRQEAIAADRERLDHLCEAIDIARTSNVKVYKVVRDGIRFTAHLVFDDRTSAGAFVQSLPRGVVTQEEGAEVIVTGLFDEEHLIEAQKKFSWIEEGRRRPANKK